MKDRLNLHRLFVDVTHEILQKGNQIRFRANGWSMHPTIRDGQVIEVDPIPPEALKPGDIGLFLEGGRVLAHRLVRKLRDSEGESVYIFQGDGLEVPDAPVSRSSVLGRVVSVERDGRKVDVNSRKSRAIQWCHRFAHRFKRKIVEGCLGYGRKLSAG